MTRITNDVAPVRREPRNKLSFVKMTLLITSGLSGAMLGFAMPNLLSGSGIVVAIKSALLAAGGMTVTYAASRSAIERGAPLSVAGYGWAGVVSAASILIVGSGMFSATYAGLTFHDVERLRIDAHGEALRDFVSERSTFAAQDAGIVPAINAVVADLARNRACEIAESCISGYSGGGNGSVARIFTEKLGKATALAKQAEQGVAARERSLEKINSLFGEYQTVASGDRSTNEIRQTLQRLDLNIRQAVADLDRAIPVSLLAAYGQELNGSVEIEGRPDVSRRITAILRAHGEAIGEVRRGLSARKNSAPPFPQQTGVTDTFAYIGHFAPIALITAVVELVLPICIWLYILFGLSWEAYRIAPPRPRALHPEDEFFQVLLPGLESKRRKDEISPATVQTAGEAPRPRRAVGRPSSLNGKRPDSTH